MSRMLIGLIVITLSLPVMAEMSPCGEAMLAVRAAKAVKKQKEKKEESQAQAEKFAKLQERYPKDVEEYQAMVKSDPDAAKRKLAKMVDRYKEDTGVDLDKTYAVKHSEGVAKQLKERISGQAPATSTTAAATAATNTTTERPKRGLVRSWLREGVDEVRGELSPPAK